MAVAGVSGTRRGPRRGSPRAAARQPFTSSRRLRLPRAKRRCRRCRTPCARRSDRRVYARGPMSSSSQLQGALCHTPGRLPGCTVPQEINCGGLRLSGYPALRHCTRRRRVCSRARLAPCRNHRNRVLSGTCSIRWPSVLFYSIRIHSDRLAGGTIAMGGIHA